MWKKRFPTWSAPFIGIGVGVYGGIPGNAITWEGILIGGGIGFLAGLLVFILELVFSSKPVVEQARQNQEQPNKGDPAMDSPQ